MPAIVTVYNDGKTDIQALRINSHTGAVFERKMVEAAQYDGGGESVQFRLTADELLIITTAEPTGADDDDQSATAPATTAAP